LLGRFFWYNDNEIMINKNKILSGAFGLLLLLLALAVNNSFSVASETGQASWDISTGNAFVRYLDVGQGDSILISLPDSTDILIDGGPGNKVLEEIGEAMPFWDKKIEVMILTHPHSDHVSGLVEILRRYKVEQIYYTGVLHTAPDYIAWLEEIKKQKIPLVIVDKQFDLKFAEQNAELEFIWPRTSLVNQRVSNLNNSSIVTKFKFGEKTFLFTGDLESPGEKDLLETGIELKADVLKVGHHGSSSSSSEAFLSAVEPIYSIVSVGKDNDFGHPHLITIRRLERIGTQIFRTDESGAIVFETDGKNIYKR